MQRRIPRRPAKFASAHALRQRDVAEKIAVDERWRGDMWLTCWGSVAFLSTLFAIDACAGALTAARAVLWVGLGALVFLALVPSRVEAGAGWLESRWLWRERLVRTDRLDSVRWSDDIARRLILRDIDGGKVELDPTVLGANPALWHLVDAGARTSMERGTLRRGHSALRQLSQRIDEETALAVFKVSGLGGSDQS